MKKWIMIMGVALLTSSVWAAKEMSVQVREGQLRNRASFLGTVTGTVAYGDRVTVKQMQAGWSEVTTAAGDAGWIHDSALTTKQVVVGSGMDEARIGASGEEIALAGKGFNKEVEAEYKRQNTKLDYAWVDRMLGFQVESAQLTAFLKQGELAK